MKFFGSMFYSIIDGGKSWRLFPLCLILSLFKALDGKGPISGSVKRAWALRREENSPQAMLLKTGRFPVPGILRLERATARGFTLTELLVVIAIMGLLITLSLPAFRGQSGAGAFNQSVEEISGILDQARSYATGQNTYVWVAFYPLDPAALPAPYTDRGGEQLCVVTYASTDGTDPVQWGSALTTVPIPYAQAGFPPSIVQIAKLRIFKQIHLETQNYFTSALIPALPVALNQPTAPLSEVSFRLSLKSPPLVLSEQPLPPGQSNKTLVVGFTPSGSAQVSSSPVSFIGLDLQPMQAAGIKNANNLAALRISGLIGLTTIYRK